MSAIENDPGWYERMAQRAAQRKEIDRGNWPVPPEIRGASARDAFLWYIIDGWNRIYGGEEAVESLLDNDFGYHVLRRGSWELRLVDTEQYPDDRWPSDTPAD